MSITKKAIGETIAMNNTEQITLEEYLRKYNTPEEKWITTHTLKTTSAPGGDIKIYIHPTGRSGDTLDFEVFGNALFELKFVKLPEVITPPEPATALRGQTQNTIICDEHSSWPESTEKNED